MEIEEIFYDLRGVISIVELLAESFENEDYQCRSAWFIAESMSFLVNQLENSLNDREKS